jgi:hypothetical protein
MVNWGRRVWPSPRAPRLDNPPSTLKLPRDYEDAKHIKTIAPAFKKPRTLLESESSFLGLV